LNIIMLMISRHMYELSRYFPKLRLFLYRFHINVVHLGIQNEHCSITALVCTMMMLSSHRRLTTRGTGRLRVYYYYTWTGLIVKSFYLINAILSLAYKIQLNDCTKRQRNKLTTLIRNIRVVTVTDNTRIPA
jgi:hypothetical protein